MSVLLLRLEGPQQAYGTKSLFNIRDTNREPTKSAVLGMLCAAFGIDRSDVHALKNLRNNLTMGIRVDCEGVVEYDYHIAGGGELPADYICGNEIIKKGEYGVKRANGRGGKDSVETVVSNRYFISDASFLVGLESDDEKLLQQCETALKNPHWQIFLGRKSFLPSYPIVIGIFNNELKNILTTYPWEPWKNTNYQPKKPDVLRIVIEDINGEEFINDQPISYKKHNRKYKRRYYKTLLVNTKKLEE